MHPQPTDFDRTTLRRPRQARRRVGEYVEVRAVEIAVDCDYETYVSIIDDDFAPHEWFRHCPRPEDVIDMVLDAQDGGVIVPGLQLARAIFEVLAELETARDGADPEAA